MAGVPYLRASYYGQVCARPVNGLLLRQVDFDECGEFEVPISFAGTGDFTAIP
jgi:hypothetical protein